MSEQEGTDEQTAVEDQAEGSEQSSAPNEEVDRDYEELREERDELADVVEQLREERDDLTARLKRTAADFQNYKKRQERAKSRIEAEATERLIGRLLDVRDNLKRAIDQQGDDVETLREGIKLTLDEFDRIMDAEGVSEINPDHGTEVDPNRHEVMLKVDSDEPAGHVAEVYQAGYELDEKVLRPAQVTVSEGAEAAEESEED